MRDVSRNGGGRKLQAGGGGAGGKVEGVFLDNLSYFDINADQWTTAAQDEG